MDATTLMAIALAVVRLHGPEIPLEQAICAGRVVYGEARGESLLGQDAVAHVLVRRSEGGQTACQIAKAPRQFAGYWIRPTDPEAWEIAVQRGVMALSGFTRDPTHCATHFVARGEQPVWKRNLMTTIRLEGHVFLRHPSSDSCATSPSSALVSR